jgi:hypothetical protein
MIAMLASGQERSLVIVIHCLISPWTPAARLAVTGLSLLCLGAIRYQISLQSMLLS